MRRANFFRLLAASCFVVWSTALTAAAADGWAEIRVVDAATGRGVPLVELETVNHVRFVTDNAGRIAMNEPGWLGRELHFSVRSHGYEVPADGFGFRGARITPRLGQVAEIKLTRTNRAERLCRLTGEGLYRDSLLLGHDVPPAGRSNRGLVAGQDSVQAAIYRDRVWWFWGDTLRMNYPLGMYRTAGATTSVFDTTAADFDPAEAIVFDYFVDKTGFARAMMPLPERPEGVVWLDGVCTVPDDDGVERLIAHYSRRKGLTDELEHGIALFDDQQAVFQVARQLDLAQTWQHPSAHPLVFEEQGKRWLLFGSPTPNVRVAARLRDVLDPTRYEAFTCARAPAGTEPEFDPSGKPRWRWQQQLPPLTSKSERAWLTAGKLPGEKARFCPADRDAPLDRIELHNGTVRWNAFLSRWVMLAGQLGGKTSLLGEVWYAEAEHPTGPFTRAVHVLTHDRQTFYNVCQHAFLDRDGGRIIYFEGTYTAEFSGNPDKTPRYDYNQILYRLDLKEVMSDE